MTTEAVRAAIAGFYAFGMLVLGQSREEVTEDLFEHLEKTLKSLRDLILEEDDDSDDEGDDEGE